MGADVTIRHAVEADLVHMANANTRADPESPLRQAWDMAQRDEGAILVAEVDGRYAGRIWVDFENAYLRSLAVDADLQNRGIGSRLIDASETLLADRGLRQAEIAVATDNPAARRLYERLGYALTGARRDEWFYVDDTGRRVRMSEECLVLVKPLPG